MWCYTVRSKRQIGAEKNGTGTSAGTDIILGLGTNLKENYFLFNPEAVSCNLNRAPYKCTGELPLSLIVLDNNG